MLVIAVLFATGSMMARPAAADPPAVWRQFHGKPHHQGVNPFEHTVGVDNVWSLGLDWAGFGDSSEFGSVYNSAPAIAGGLAYFGDTNGELYAFDANGCGQSACEPVWKAILMGGGIYNSPAVVNGVVYVGTSSTEGALYALDAAGCGTPFCVPLWQSTPLNVIDSSPTVANGVVYVGSGMVNPPGVYAFASQGCGTAVCPPLWRGETEDLVDNSPAVWNGIVYVGDTAGKLYAFDAHGCGSDVCAPLWTGQLGAGTFASSPAVWNGVVYIGSFWDGRLNAFAAGGCGQPTCQPLWKGDAGQYVFSAPAVANGRVYIGAGDAQLKVFDAAGCGQPLCPPLWIGYMVGAQAGMESAPLVANGVVYVGENNSDVAAFDAAGCGQSECQPLWQYHTQDPIVNSSPVIVDGTLYVAGSNFGITPELYVFKLGTQQRKAAEGVVREPSLRSSSPSAPAR
jgi:outer membrane protein assembly factor BamB